MKTRRIMVLGWIILGVCSGLVLGLDCTMPSEPNYVHQIVAGNTAFGLEMYQQLSQGKAGRENLFFSPYSISTALAMVFAGTGGQTEKEMMQTLHFFTPQGDFHKAFGALEQQLNEQGQSGSYELTVANALWAQAGYPFKDAFLERVQDSYSAGVKHTDFAADPEKARQEINAWVEEKTRDRIEELFKQGVIDARTAMVLANAIYFKGKWAAEFDPKLTKEADFTKFDGGKMTAQMMYKKARFAYGEYDTQAGSLQVIELPYREEELSMVVLLTGKTDGLTKLEQRLAPEQLAKWMDGLKKKEVELYLPKFTMTWESELQKILAGMGMPSAFSGNADFSGMTDRRDLTISAVVHKAFVQVNEEGTEAAAATGVAIRLTAIGTPPPVFRADHPFLFLIRDNASGSILFMGRAAEPKTQ